MGNCKLPYKLLLHGLDTVECAYYLLPRTRNRLENILEPLKEKIRSTKNKCEEITLAGVKFLLFSSGTASGYTYQLKNSAYHIQFGGNINPNFFVTFSSEALWHYGVYQLHQTFLQFALSIGYLENKPEGISRIDHATDYHVPIVDFDRKDFLSQCRKGSLNWEGQDDQTISIGKTPIRLRVYDKVAEIAYSGRNRPVIPVETGHPFRFKSAT